MREIALVNMPFADVHRPTIALTQLRSVVRSVRNDVVADVFYMNLDFAESFGLKDYAVVANTMESLISGLGEWFFRPIAFPDVPDNSEAYLRRYLRHFGANQEQVRKVLTDLRPRAAALLDELIDRYRLAEYRIVGATSMFQQNVASFALARRIKDRNPGVVTVLGGANCDAPMGGVIAKNVDAVDFVFSGPALVNFPAFVNHVLDGEMDRCHELKGVYSKRKLSGLSPEGREIGEELPIEVDVPLDYDDYFEALGTRFPPGSVRISLLFETSRGCWWGAKAHCTFCGLNAMTMAYRGMLADSALKRIQELIDRYADRVSRFEAVDNIMPKEYLTDVFPHIRSPKVIFYEVKADLKEPELAILAEAGVREIQPGIEALATSTLKLMRKGTTSFQNVSFLKACVAHGIQPVWNLLVGFPGETGETYAKYVDDLPRLAHLPPPTGSFPVRFDRFSPYFDKRDDYGLSLAPYDFYSMVYPFPEKDLERLAYYFMDLNFDAPYVTEMVKWIVKLRERIAQWRTRWLLADKKLKPELRFERGGLGTSIYDSRSGSAVEHRLEEARLRVLESLTRPKRAAVVASELGMPEAEAAIHVDALDALGLVFREGDSVLSLVLEPPVAISRQPSAVKGEAPQATTTR